MDTCTWCFFVQKNLSHNKLVITHYKYPSAFNVTQLAWIIKVQVSHYNILWLHFPLTISLSHRTTSLQWNSVIARADGPGTFSRYCRVLVIPKWQIYQVKQREIILALAPYACRGVHRVTNLEKFPVPVSKDEAFHCFSLLPATTRCALPETWRRGGGGARTFVTRKDRKSVVITEMIIH